VKKILIDSIVKLKKKHFTKKNQVKKYKIKRKMIKSKTKTNKRKNNISMLENENEKNSI
jgi:hypothetical protein